MILEQYFRVKWAARDQEIRELFCWPSPQTSVALEALVQNGRIQPCEICGKGGSAHAVMNVEDAVAKLRR